MLSATNADPTSRDMKQTGQSNGTLFKTIEASGQGSGYSKQSNLYVHSLWTIVSGMAIFLYQQAVFTPLP